MTIVKCCTQNYVGSRPYHTLHVCRQRMCRNIYSPGLVQGTISMHGSNFLRIRSRRHHTAAASTTGNNGKTSSIHPKAKLAGIVLGISCALIASVLARSPLLTQGQDSNSPEKHPSKPDSKHPGSKNKKEDAKAEDSQESQLNNISKQLESLRIAVAESISTLQTRSRPEEASKTGKSSPESQSSNLESKAEQKEGSMSKDSWYSGILSSLDLLSRIPPLKGQSSPKKQPESSSREPSSNDNNYISWLRGAKEQLDELSEKIQSANWGSDAVAPTTRSPSPAEAADSPTDGDQASYVDSMRQQIQAQIESLQSQIGARVDGAKAAWGDTIYGLLPEQLQLPWVTACAQMCLDPNVHPELLQPASVRIGHEVCSQEANFRLERAKHMRNDFAEYIGVPAASVDERDIPIIGVAGSGGGFRAMVATIGYYRAMHISGFLRCVTYDAAVSGSSWAIGALHTYADGSPLRVLDNVREAMRNSMFSTSNLMTFVKSNDGIAKHVFVEMATKYLLYSNSDQPQSDKQSDANSTHAADNSDSGCTEHQPTGANPIAHRLLQQGERLAGALFPEYLKNISADAVEVLKPSDVDELIQAAKSAIERIPTPQMSIVDLYGALLFKQLIVEHKPGLKDSEEAELSLNSKWTRLSAQREGMDEGRLPMPIYTAVRHFIGSADNDTESTESHGYQWFEFTPYEFGSIDHGAWIPAWAFGRPMADGQDQMRIGEAHFGSVMGTVASAFCASVKAMVMEVYMNIPTALHPVVDPLLDWFEKDTEVAHVVPPYTLYNPFFRTHKKRSTGDELLAELESEQLLSLMDAGLENNLPFAPLLRKERNVDMIVCLDSSANIDIMPWFARAEAWAAKHEVGRWPWGARPWAADPLRPSKSEIEMSRSMLSSTKEASKATEGRLKDRNVKCAVFDRPLAPSPLRSNSSRLSSAPEPSTTILYLPLTSNKEFRDPEFDPETADFCATFNDKWMPEQVDLLADLTSFNFMQEAERIRSAVKEAYERKRAYRLYLEGLEE